MKPLLTLAALVLCLAACSSEPAEAPGAESGARNDSKAAAVAPAASPATPPAEAPPGATLLSLEGLGPLKIGEPVPAASGWAERGVQISDTCRTVSSPGYPGVYAIVEESRVRRITLGRGSRVRLLLKGVGVGASEAEVRRAYPDLREDAHAYVDPPAKYLTARDAGRDPAFRFEIGADGRVSLIHVGTMPVLGYVEGCA